MRASLAQPKRFELPDCRARNAQHTRRGRDGIGGESHQRSSPIESHVQPFRRQMQVLRKDARLRRRTVQVIGQEAMDQLAPLRPSRWPQAHEPYRPQPSRHAHQTAVSTSLPRSSLIIINHQRRLETTVISGCPDNCYISETIRLV